jgi:hypothetical protein
MLPPSSVSKNKPREKPAGLAACSKLVFAFLILRSWRWKRYVPPKRRLTFNELYNLRRSWESSFSIDTSYDLDIRRVWVWAPVKKRSFSYPRRPNWFWGPFSFLFNVYRGLFPRSKPTEAWSWPLPTNAKVNNTWNNTSTSPYVFMVCSAELVKHRNDFTFFHTALYPRTILKWIREIVWNGVDWMDMAQDRDQWRVLVNTILNLRVP